MNTVWKFQIPALTEFDLSMPKNAQIIHVDSQFDQACLWAVVDSAGNRPFHQAASCLDRKADDRLG